MPPKEKQKAAAHVVANVHATDNAQIHIDNMVTAGVVNHNYVVQQDSLYETSAPNLELLATGLIQLANYYKCFCNLKGVLAADRPYPLDAIFVQLVLIPNQEQQEREQALGEEKIWNTSYEDRQSTVETIYRKSEKIISLKYIFNQESYHEEQHSHQAIKQPKSLLLMGCAGVGKTTLCNYIAYQWAEKKELFTHQFQGVIWITLRQLNKNRYPEQRGYLLWEILLKESGGTLNASQAKEMENAIRRNPEKFLFLLDGYDELLPEVTQGYLTTVFEQLSAMPYCIITSRPRSTHELRFDYRLEIMGFSQENVRKFADEFFKQAKPNQPKYVETLTDYLKKIPSLAGIMQIPILLTMACELHMREELLGKTDTDSPKTMTELYRKLVDELFKKFAIKSKGKSPETCTPRVVQTVCKSVRLSLEYLALQGLLDKKVIFTEDDLDVAVGNTSGSDTDDDDDEEITLEMFQSGLLRKTIQTGPEYYFIHLTFQEFFAANAVANKISRYSELENLERVNLHRLLSEHKYNPRFQLVWVFTSGLLAKNQIALEKFFELLKSFSPDILGFYENNLMLRCLEAAQAPDALKDKKNILSKTVQGMAVYFDNGINYDTYHRTEIELSCRTTIEQSYFCARDKFFIQEIIDEILTKNVSYQVNEKTIRLLEKIGAMDNAAVFTRVIDLAISNGNSAAQDIVSRVWAEQIAPTFRQKIIIALKDSKISDTLSLLKKITRAVSKDAEIIRELINIATQQKWGLDFDASAILVEVLSKDYSLSEVDLKTITTAIMETALRTQNVLSSNIFSTVKTFCNANTGYDMRCFIFPILTKNLSSSDNDIRYRAAIIIEAIAKIFIATPTDNETVIRDIVLALMNAIQKDTDKDVVYAACAAIGEFGPIAIKVAPDIINVLKTAALHTHVYISRNATKALQRLQAPKTISIVAVKSPEVPNNQAAPVCSSPSSSSVAVPQEIKNRNTHPTIINTIPIHELINIILDVNTDKFSKLYAFDALCQPSSKTMTEEQIIMISNLLADKRYRNFYNEILRVIERNPHVAAIKTIIFNLLKIKNDVDSFQKTQGSYPTALFYFFQKSGLVSSSPAVQSKIENLSRGNGSMHFLLVEKIVKPMFIMLYAKCMHKEHFKTNHPQKIGLIQDILDGSIPNNTKLTFDDLTCQGLIILDKALQRKDNYIKAATILVSLCKDYPVGLFGPSICFCLDCVFHNAYVNTDELLKTLGTNASVEHLFEMALNNETYDKNLFIKWLLNRLNKLSGAIFVDPKDNAICIWEKGALKRSHGLSQNQLAIFFGKITEFYHFTHLAGKSMNVTYGSVASTLFPIHPNYSSASTSSSSNFRVSAKNNFMVSGAVVPEGYQVGSAIANGNCLFDSVAQLINNGQNAHDLRLLAANYMRSHKEEFADFFVNNELDTRIDRMATSLEHADHCEVSALAKALQRQIIVISNNKVLPVVGDAPHPILYLHHEFIEFQGIQVGHYQPFIFRNSLILSNLKK